MSAWRYGFLSLSAHSWDIELNASKEISELQAIMIYIVYSYEQEQADLIINY